MPSADIAGGPAGPGGPGLRYHELHRLGRSGRLRALLGIALVVAGVLVGGVVAGGLVALAAAPFGDELTTDPLTPAGLAWVTLSWAVVVPLVVLVVGLVHGTARFTASVVGRIRWRWLFTCAGLALISLVVVLVLALALPENGGAAVDSSANDITDRTLAFALIILLLIPLQSAGEEYAFRGYLTQAVGGVLPGRAGVALAVVVPALLFALAHGVQDPPVFIDRFMFGLVAGTLVILTGGLEAGIAMHVLNNWVFFGLALLFGDISEALAPVAGTWWLLPVTLVQSLGYLGLVTWAARRRDLGTATTVGVLEGKVPRV